MAFIDYCKKNLSSAAIEAVCINPGESEILLPVVEKEVKNARTKVEYYEDLTCDGFGTKLQETKLLTWQNKLEVLESIEKTLREILKSNKQR